MATSAQTLVNRTRRMLRDWPDYDTTTASISNSGTTLALADTSIYSARWDIELEQEVMTVRAIAGGTSLTVKRGAKGSTASSHATATAVLVKPRFFTVEIIDALNAGLAACFPYIYKPVVDVTTATAQDTYEYTVPSMPGTTVPIPMLSKVEVKINGDLSYREIGHWQVRRDATTPKIVLKRPFDPSGTLKFFGYGPFPPLTDAASTLDAAFPAEGEELLALYACQQLLISGEAFRVAQDVGVQDNREQANRTGSSMAASNGMLQRFQLALRNAQMPPLPVHVVSTM